jgi:hypothetical protein
MLILICFRLVSDILSVFYSIMMNTRATCQTVNQYADEPVQRTPDFYTCRVTMMI